MGEVYAEITLRNPRDRIQVLDGLMEKEERSVTITAVVDTGALLLVMGEELRKQLGLEINETSIPAHLAGGIVADGYITEPVEIFWKKRSSCMRALVLPGQEEVLLGVLPLEELDLIVDPRNQELIGAHGDRQSLRIPGGRVYLD